MKMGTWKSNKIQKKHKGSQTPGKTKGGTCQATAMDRYFAKSSRSYKHPDYGKWCKAMDSVNGG